MEKVARNLGAPETLIRILPRGEVPQGPLDRYGQTQRWIGDQEAQYGQK
jgi:hypothetical protein